MKHLWKKIVSIAAIVTMVLAFNVSAFAGIKNADGTLSADDTGKVTINGLQDGDQVTFYQIVKANYGDAGFTGFEAVTDKTIELFDTAGNAIYPSAEQIADLAKDTSKLTKKVGPVEATG